MATYTVHLISVISTSIDVEADDVNQAIELAYDSPRMPGSMSYGAYSNASVDESGEWEPRAVTDDSGAEVWTDKAESV